MSREILRRRLDGSFFLPSSPCVGVRIGFYTDSKIAPITLSLSHPSATDTILLGPKAGILVGTVADAVTGASRFTSKNHFGSSMRRASLTGAPSGRSISAMTLKPLGTPRLSASMPEKCSFVLLRSCNNASVSMSPRYSVNAFVSILRLLLPPRFDARENLSGFLKNLASAYSYNLTGGCQPPS